jgi:hypothetical protein
MYRRPLPKPWQYWSQRRINTLADGLHAQRYLEIGIEHGRTAEKINVRERVGVDPAPRFDTNNLPSGFPFFAVESDTYFASLASEATFDLAFLDGLHTFEQTKIDLFNTLRHVPSGVILIDDTIPEDETAALPDQDEARALRRETGSKEKAWMGDVWKLVVYIDQYLPQLDFRTIVGSGNVQTLVCGAEHLVRPSPNLLGMSWKSSIIERPSPEAFRISSGLAPKLSQLRRV